MKCMKDDPSIMGSDYFIQLKTWADTSHKLHNNMWGHTVGEILLGWGLVNKNVQSRN